MPLGERIGDAYIRIFGDGSEIPANVKEGMDDAEPEAEAGGGRHAGAYNRGFRRQLKRDRGGTHKEIMKSFPSDSDFKHIQQNTDRWAKHFNRRVGDAGDHVAGLRQQIDLYFRRLADGGDAANRGLHKTVTGLHKYVDATEEATESTHRMRAALRAFRPNLGEADRDLSQLHVTIGRAFGSKSRNNFLHFFGQLVGNAVHLGITLAETTFKVAKFAATLFSKVDDMGRFASAGAKLAPVLATAATGLVAAGAAGIILVAVMGPLIAMFSLALGVVTALAASLTFALLGGLGAVLGAVLPLAAAVAVLVAGIAGMDDAMKATLKRAVQPMVRELKILGDIAAEGMFSDLASQAEGMSTVFRNMRPLVRGISEAMSDVFSTFINGMKGPGFNAFLRAMEGFLPDAIRKLGTISAQTFGGIGGLFVSLIPLTERFLGWLDRITQRFQDFTNSTSGQAKLKAFWKDAGDSASQFGGLLKSVIKLLAEVFDAGRGTGDSIFGSMSDEIDRWTKKLHDNPKILSNWFKDSEEFARQVGATIKSISALMDSFDDAGSRGDITNIFRGAAATIGEVSKAVSILRGAFVLIRGPINTIIKMISGDMAGAVADMLSTLEPMVRGMANLADAVGLDGLANKLDGVAKKWRGLVEDVRNPAKPKTDNSELDDTIDKSRKTREELLGLFHLGGKVNYSKKELEAVKEAVNGVMEKLRNVFNFSGKVNYTKAELDEARRAANSIEKKLKTLFTISGKANYSKREIEVAITAANSIVKKLRTLFGVKGKANYSKAEIEAAIKAAKEIIRKLQALGLMKTKPKVSAEEIAAGKRKTQEMINTMRVAAGMKPIRLKADASSVAAAKRVVASFNSLWNSIGGTKRLNVVTHYSRTGTQPTASGGLFAEGGVVDGMAALSRSMQWGGMVNWSQLIRAGESGREAVVPLDRPLNEIDPAVRALAAIAQGKALPGNNDQSRSIDASGWIITSPTSDPSAVATEVLNKLVATGY